MYAQLPCVIVTYIPGKDLVAAKIGISRKGCSKRPIYIQLRRFQSATDHGVIAQECTNKGRTLLFDLDMAKEVTKETAMRIYNLYSQIDTTEKIIADLNEFIQKWNEGGQPPVVTDNYNPYGSIEISIPYFEAGKFKQGGARVFNISYPAAMKVLKSHLRSLKNTLKKVIGEVE